MSDTEQDVINKIRARVESRMMNTMLQKQHERTCPTCGHVKEDWEFEQEKAKPPTD